MPHHDAAAWRRLLLQAVVVLACIAARSDAFAVKTDDNYESPLDEAQLAAPRSEVPVATLACTPCVCVSLAWPCACLCVVFVCVHSCARQRVCESTCAYGRSRALCTYGRPRLYHITRSPGHPLTAPAGQGGKRKISELKAKYARDFDAATAKWVTITSVNPPTTQVQKLCSISGWNKVIVADKKTPPDWVSAGCFFLSLEDQAALEYKTHSAIPYMRYERKMLGIYSPKSSI